MRGLLLGINHELCMRFYYDFIMEARLKLYFIVCFIGFFIYSQSIISRYLIAKRQAVKPSELNQNSLVLYD